MKRFTYRGEHGEAYLDYTSTDYNYAIQRFAELEDLVESAEKIQSELSQNDMDKNMLELHPKAQFVICDEEQTKKMDRVRLGFSELFYLLDDLCNGSPEYDAALQRLEEAQFWAIKGISRE